MGSNPLLVATLDSSRTLVREEAIYTDAAGDTNILSQASNLSLLHAVLGVKLNKVRMLLNKTSSP